MSPPTRAPGAHRALGAPLDNRRETTHILHMLKSFAKLMRPKHYVKNVLIFVPLVYSFNLTNADMLLHVFICFCAMCLGASGVYAANDIADCEKDKLHPKNKTRPVAAGAISKPVAAAFALFLFLAGGALMFLFGGTNALFLTAAFVILNLAYSFILKNIAVVDCFCVAASFVLRVFVGGAVIGAGISEWLFLTVVATALFLAFGKRRGELLKLGIGGDGREVLRAYTPAFLSGIVFTCAGAGIVFYALWAMESTAYVLYTVPLVIFIICKYLLSAESPENSEKIMGDPVSIVFFDKILLGAIIFFGVLSVFFLYVVE